MEYDLAQRFDKRNFELQNNKLFFNVKAKKSLLYSFKLQKLKKFNNVLSRGFYDNVKIFNYNKKRKWGTKRKAYKFYPKVPSALREQALYYFCLAEKGVSFSNAVTKKVQRIAYNFEAIKN